MAQASYSELLLFGDSLLDAGNLGVRFTNRVGDGNGDFSTGDFAEIAPQHLARALGLSSDPAALSAGGTNYAVGGYETADVFNSIAGSGLALPAGGTVARAAYLSEHTSVASRALVLIDGGGNDFLNGTAFDAASIQASAQTLLGGVNALHAAGARYIMLSNLPDLGKTPAGQARELSAPGSAAATSAAAAGYNSALRIFSSFSPANIIPVDLAGLETYVANNADKFGFVSGTNAAFPAPLDNFDQIYMCFDASGGDCIEHPVFGISGSAPDPSKLLFDDGIHPTARLGKIAGDYIADVVLAPQSVGQIPQLGLNVASNQYSGIAQIQRENRWLPVTDRGFISLSSLSADVVDGDQTNTGVTVGLNRVITPVLSMGVAVNIASHSAETSRSDFSASSFGVSGLMNYRENRWLAEASVGLSVVDYGDLDRDVLLGGQRLTATGESEGHSWFVDAQIAFDMLPAENYSLAPALGLYWGAARVDGYTESGGEISNYSWDEQRRASRQLRLGVIANIALSDTFSLQADAFAVSEQEDYDEDIGVRNTNLSYAGYRLSSYQKDGDTFSELKLAAVMSMEKARLSLAFDLSDEAEGSEQLSVNYSRPF